jgi:hypothetical protein
MRRAVIAASFVAGCHSAAPGSGAPTRTSVPDSGANFPGEAAAETNVTADAGAPRAAPETNRLHLVTGVLEIFDKPSVRAPKVGTVRFGGSVELSDPSSPAARDGDCADGWFAAVPRGFVCADRKTTRDPLAPAARVSREYRLASHAALPAAYGIAEIAPVYLRLPTWEEQVRSEPGLEEHLHKRAALRAAQGAARSLGDSTEGRDADLYPTGADLPDDLRVGSFAPLAPKPLAPNSPVTGFLGPGSRVAWVAEFDGAGRTWLITPELLLVPRDKVKRSVVSGFRGTEVPEGKGVAFVGRRPARRFHRDAERDAFVQEATGFAPDTAILLAEPPSSDRKYLESSEPGIFVRADEVVKVIADAPSRFGLDGDAGEGRWIDFNAKTQVLLLREGARVSYATLASGAADTRRGKLRVSSKYLTLAIRFERAPAAGARAEVPEALLLSENANGTPASVLYAGWWMSSWGAPNGSFGIALSPFDARRLFDFASPPLPEGWHSVRGEGTWVVVHD